MILERKLCFINTPSWILDSSAVRCLLRFLFSTHKPDRMLNSSHFLQYLAMTLQTHVSNFSAPFPTCNH